MFGNIAKRWKKLSGEENWRNLLHPLDNDLRRYIIHYGEMAQATYDTFNSEKDSKHAGDSKFSMKNLFSKVGLETANPFKYKPVKYIYATSGIQVPECFILKSLSRESWCRESNWIGFIAVATEEGKELLGRRDIVVAWRGTNQALELVNDFEFPLVPAFPVIEAPNNPLLHKGWLSIYTSENPKSPFNVNSARDQVIDEVKQLVEKYKDEKISITVTGHSMGAAMATLNAVDIVYNGFNKNTKNPDKPCPVTAFSFACPRVGDSKFKEIFHSIDGLHCLRIRNIPDIVPTLPAIGYSEVGEELEIATPKSKYLKSPGNFTSWHNLECYLHGIAGSHGSEGEFHLEVDRDIALINKHVNALKDEYGVPPMWQCLENKGLVQQDDGSWEVRDHDI